MPHAATIFNQLLVREAIVSFLVIASAEASYRARISALFDGPLSSGTLSWADIETVTPAPVHAGRLTAQVCSALARGAAKTLPWWPAAPDGVERRGEGFIEFGAENASIMFRRPLMGGGTNAAFLGALLHVENVRLVPAKHVVDFFR